MPLANPKTFAKGFRFMGSINGQQLGWTKARVMFDYRHGAEHVLFAFECGLELKVVEVKHAPHPDWPPTTVETQHVCPRLKHFARPGEEMSVSVEQLDADGIEVGRWSSTQAKLVEYSVSWDNAADAITPERIIFEAPADTVKGPNPHYQGPQ